MATYTVNSTNWNDPAFWAAINETSGPHTFDFSLNSSYTVVYDENAGTITLSDGTQTFVVGEAGYAGPSNVTLGGTTQLSYFNVLLGTDGSDRITTGDDDRYARGYTGNDSIVTGAGADTLIGDSGNDTLNAGGGDDALFGGSGSDLLIGGAGNDQLEGGSGNDSLSGGDGNDTLEGGTGSDTMSGGAGSDFFVIENTFTNETIFGGESAGDADVISLIGTFANPATVNFTGDDSGTLTSGTSTITFDEIEGIGLTDGNDSVFGASATDNLWIEGDGGADSIVTGSGADVIYGGDGDDILQSGAGADNVFGDFGADSIDGGTGDDFLVGGSGIDTILGGTGDDTIFGDGQEMGRDAGSINGFVFEAGNITATGTDVDGNGSVGSFAIYDNVGTTSDGTIVQAKLTLIGASDPTVSIEYDNGVRLNYNSDVPAGTEVTFQIEFFDQATGAPIKLDGALTFKDIDTTAESVSMASNDVTSVSVSSTPATDLTVFNTPEVIGVTSNSTSSTAADENHWAQFGIEDQNTVEFTVTTRSVGTLYTFASDDFTNPPATTASTPEPQQDSLVGGDGADVLYGGMGVDTIEGGAGADTLYGGDDADLMSGGSDADRFMIEDGFGADTIVGDEGVSTGSDFDTLDLSMLSGNATITGTGDEAGTATDGTDTLSFVEIEAIETGAGTDSINTTADTTGLSISAGDGADTVFAGSGSDTVQGGAGNDLIDLGAGDDVYTDGVGGTGNDTVSGGAGNDAIAEGAGNDLIQGGTGNDTLSGGAGADTILGGDDADLIVIGDDNDTDLIQGGEGGTDFDTLSFTSVSATDGVNVLLTGNEAGTYDFFGTTGQGNFSEIEALSGTAYGDSMNASASSSSQTMSGNAGDDTLTGGSGADTISGGDGNDVITGGSGDSISGGAGDDTINISAADVSGGTIFVDGGETGETSGDVLNIQGPATFTAGADAESGSYEFLDGTVLTYSNIETVNYVPCFTPGTLIKTLRGAVSAEDLEVGDRVLTRDTGFQTIRWIGARQISPAELAADPALAPITIKAGALGRGCPAKDLTVSPQHRVLRGDAMSELLFGETEVLVAARNLTHLDGIDVTVPRFGVRYIHFMCDRHEIVLSDGAWTETFQPGAETLDAIGPKSRERLFAAFPELRTEAGQNAYQAARPTLKSYQSRALFAA